MSREALEELQPKRLRHQVTVVYERVPLYRQSYRARGIRPVHIQSLDDLRNLPFTYKRDFRDNYPFGLLAVPRR